MSWKTFLESACPAEHAVQVYTELDELASSVASFLDAGFRAGEPALVIVTPEHWAEFRTELEQRGSDVDHLQAEGMLTCRDADETLATFMQGEGPSAELFETAVGGTLDEIAGRFPEQTVRAFGEMVDLLFQQRRQAAAIALEDLWNRLLEERRCALLCAYELDVFDLAAQTSALPEIIRTHTHPRPVADTARLAAAVHETLTETLGSHGAARIYLRVAEEVPRTDLPRAQVVLMWLSRHQPRVAERVLQGARARYAQAA
ncbi:MAG TPA: MEDS domain-containing protein [Gaiellaceae bacterium]|nr:MEDS domain-containing protein [Gaiellaceae bacterium]